MRFIHTADWHLGKKLREHPLIDDQAYILNEFLKIIDDQKPEAIIIAGDVYDSGMPPVTAIDLFDEILTKLLLEKKIPVLCIAGNHDSSSRLNFGSRLFESNRLFLRTKTVANIEPIILNDEYGEICFSMIPYFYPSKVREIFGIEEGLSYDDAAAKLVSEARKYIKNNQRSVAVAHLFIKGATRSESEVEMVGGIDEINYEHFLDFNYVALGHLHSPQYKKYEKIRYSGSLLKYSFDEEKQKKGIDVVDIDGEGSVKIESIPLIPKRDVRIVKGFLDDILREQSATGDYILARLKDDNPYNAGEKLRSAIYPNLLGVENVSEREITASIALRERENLNDAELFETFFKDMTGRAMNDQEYKAFMECMNDLKGGDGN